MQILLRDKKFLELVKIIYWNVFYHNKLNGAPEEIRTPDLRLRRPTLYPLSYRRNGSNYNTP